LRALQSHDSRLSEDPVRFVQTYASGSGSDGSAVSGQLLLEFSELSAGLYAHVVSASGLGKPGLLVSQEIEAAVRAAARIFREAGMEERLARAMDIFVPPTSQMHGSESACIIAALLLTNACLLHRRLSDIPKMAHIPTLNTINGASSPYQLLRQAWQSILQVDYRPVFAPAIAILVVLSDLKYIRSALHIIIERANSTADSLSDLGYDHAGPLYHRILPSASSDGAFYTNNISALMLARLALNVTFVDWSDMNAVRQLRIMDPACGTGTLTNGGVADDKISC